MLELKFAHVYAWQGVPTAPLARFVKSIHQKWLSFRVSPVTASAPCLCLPCPLHRAGQAMLHHCRRQSCCRESRRLAQPHSAAIRHWGVGGRMFVRGTKIFPRQYKLMASSPHNSSGVHCGQDAGWGLTRFGEGSGGGSGEGLGGFSACRASSGVGLGSFGLCVVGRKAGLRPAMKGTSCVRRLRLRSFWFLLCVLQRVVVPVCVVLCVSWICGCGSHWNGCMIVVIWCCHVRRSVQVCHVMLQNAMLWLRQGCLAPRLHAQYYSLLQLDIVNRDGAAPRLRY